MAGKRLKEIHAVRDKGMGRTKPAQSRVTAASHVASKSAALESKDIEIAGANLLRINSRIEPDKIVSLSLQLLNQLQATPLMQICQPIA